jgi:hypothetical protein
MRNLQVHLQIYKYPQQIKLTNGPRIRRVKCDEGRPSCHRCTSTGRKCDGYVQTAQTRTQLSINPNALPKNVTKSPNTSGLNNEFENDAFQYYLSKTTRKTNAFFNSDFWDRLVLQISHSEPAVKHAVLALGSLHRSWEKNHQKFILDKTALFQYNKALSYASKMISQSQSHGTRDRESLEKLLVSCILFICYENLVGNYGSAQMHLKNGLSILLGHSGKMLPGPAQEIEDDVIHLLGRFDLQAMIFSDDISPYQYLLSELDGPTLTPLPAKFSSLSEARQALFDLTRHIFRFGEVVYKPGDPGPQFHLQKEQCETDLRAWISLFESYVSHLSLSEAKKQRHAITLLRIYQITVTYIVTAGFTGQECAYDNNMPQFKEILSMVESIQVGGYSGLAQTEESTARTCSSSSDTDSDSTSTPRILKCAKTQPFFSLELGITIPLFNFAIKCRDPILRRRAIAIMRFANRREGLWDSTAAADVAQRVVDVEEEGAVAIRGVVISASQIPEDRRIVIVQSMVNVEKGLVRLRLLSRPNPASEDFMVREEWVQY